MLLSWYIIRAHIGPFFFGTVTVMFVFLLNFLIVFLPQIVGKGLTLWVIIQLIALNLAWIVVIAVPLGTLVATLMAFGNLSASNEITIIRAGGGGLLRMMLPIIGIGIALSAGLYWFNDEVLPEANHRALTLRMDIERKKPTFVMDKGQFSTQIEGYSILARRLDTAQGRMLGVTMYDNTKFDQMNVISADTGFINFSSDYKKVVLILVKGELHQINQQNPADYRRILFEKHRIIMDASGFDFSQTDEKFTSRGDRTMKIRDMQKVVQESQDNSKIAQTRIALLTEAHSKEISRTEDSLQKKTTAEFPPTTIPITTSNTASKLVSQFASKPATNAAITTTNTAILPAPKPLTRKEAAWRAESRMSGLYSSVDNELFQIRDRQLNANKYLVEIHKKYVIPLACLVFVLIGCPLGIVTKRGNLGVSGIITIVFYVIYWAFLMTGERFADRGLIEPRLSMWLSDIILGVVGLFLMFRVQKDLPIVNFTPVYGAWKWLRGLVARGAR